MKANKYSFPACLSFIKLVLVWLWATSPCQAAEMVMTNITSTTDTMISFRFQEHSWVVADGRVLAVTNDGNGLVFYSQKSAALWNRVLTLTDSGENSTVDGFMDKDRLYLAWNTSMGGLRFGVFSDTDGDGQWSVDLEIMARARSEECWILRPTIAPDNLGRLWLAYTCVNAEGTIGTLAMSLSPDNGVNWFDVQSGINVRGYPLEVNARITHTANGLMLIYTYGIHTANGRYLIKKSAFLADDSPEDHWLMQDLQNYFYPYGDKVHDTYGTHFSVVGDGSGNVHLATVNNKGALVYYRYHNGSWEAPRLILDGKFRPGYMQFSLGPTGYLYLTANFLSRPVVFWSQDGGNHFSFLVSPRPVASEGYPRIETPTHIKNSLPILLQTGLTTSNFSGYALQYQAVGLTSK